MGARVGFLLFALLTVSSVGAQQKKLKVLISADMEGVGGVVTWDVQADPKGREYEKFRRLMTQEVNAAVAGAADAGATAILVVDSHNDGQNRSSRQKAINSFRSRMDCGEYGMRTRLERPA